jgi:hypothetical protein
MSRRMRSGDVAWLAILTGAVIYELAADDLLSEASERYYTAHPVFTRMVIMAVAGHLAGLLPARVDVFDANNVLHRGIVKALDMDRSKRDR